MLKAWGRALSLVWVFLKIAWSAVAAGMSLRYVTGPALREMTKAMPPMPPGWPDSGFFMMGAMLAGAGIGLCVAVIYPAALFCGMISRPVTRVLEPQPVTPDVQAGQ